MAVAEGPSGKAPIPSFKYWSVSNAVAISPDGKTLALGGLGWLKLLNTKTWRSRKVFKGYWKQPFFGKDWVSEIAFSPDGKLLAAGGINSVVKVWRTKDWHEAYTLTQNGQGFVSIAFSPIGKLLVTANGADMQFWDAKTKDLQNTIKCDCQSVEFSPNGKLVVTTNEAGSVEIWKVPVSVK